MLFIEGSKDYTVDNTIAMLNGGVMIPNAKYNLAVLNFGHEFVEVAFTPSYDSKISKEIDGNEGYISSHVIRLIQESDKKYMLGFYYQKHVTVENRDNMPDRRYSWMPHKPKFTFPKYDFLDGYVFVNSRLEIIDRHNGYSISREAIIFHELAECYARVDLSMSGVDAHIYACDLEVKILKRRKYFTKGLAGYGEKTLMNVKYNKNAIPTVIKSRYRGVA